MNCHSNLLFIPFLAAKSIWLPIYRICQSKISLKVGVNLPTYSYWTFELVFTTISPCIFLIINSYLKTGSFWMFLYSSPASETQIRFQSFTNSSFYTHSQRSIFFAVVRSTEKALSRHHLLLEADTGYCTIPLLLLLRLIVNFTNWTTLSPLDCLFDIFIQLLVYIHILNPPFQVGSSKVWFYVQSSSSFMCSLKATWFKQTISLSLLHGYADDTLLYPSSTSKPIHNCQRFGDLKITWAHNGFMSNELRNMLE